LRLALQSLYIVGASINDENTDLRQINFNADEGFTSIVAGKEFMLMVSSSGKVLLSSSRHYSCAYAQSKLFFLRFLTKGKLPL
jgi:hypothetical protein